MKQILFITIVAIFTVINACGNSPKKGEKIDLNEEIVERLDKEEKPRVSVSTIKSSVLVLNMENEIYVNVSTISPDKLHIEINEELIYGNKYGLFKITPKKLGKITVSVIADVNGRQEAFGKVNFNVVKPEATISEIFNMN